MESIRDCKYGCGKKIKYDTVSFSDGFTVSIPWESTAKGDLADLRMENVDPAEDEYVPASMILYLGIEKFLGLLELRDLSLTSTMEVNGISESGLKIMQTDDEFNAELAQPPTDEDFKEATETLWDSLEAEERKKTFEDENLGLIKVAAKAIVKIKDPVEYLKRLEFHNSVKDHQDYFF